MLPIFSLNAAEPVKMLYAAPTSLPAAICYLAGIKNYFKEEGLEVEEKMFSSGRDALEALLAKQAQLQSVSETPVVHAIVQGNDIVTIATVSEHHEARVIARIDHGISKPEDIKGKKIATAAGTNSDYFMYEFLKKYNLKTTDVQITNMKAPDMKVALVKGDIDAYFAWEPHIYYAKKELGEKAIIFPPGDLYDGRQTVNMNREYALQNPEVVRKVIRALLKAETFIKKNPAEAKKLIATKLKIEVADMDAMWNEITFKVELDKNLPGIMEKIGAWSFGVNKKTGALPDFKSHIYKEALLKEKKSAVEIK
jgi:NitT/TauT family transport system substrate-binding protein